MAAIIPNICKALRIQFLSRQRALLLRKMSGKAISDCDESTGNITEASSDCDKSTENITEIFPNERVYKYPVMQCTDRYYQEHVELRKELHRRKLVIDIEGEFNCAGADDNILPSVVDGDS
ncbi:hypothetical protein V6N12_015061 [Hibiscus sabdariffa]|uniref:Uncharacterized protein n=1 Tax=Hibiscus sabdariffa TaxID=183260 RepID=A0ABR2DNA1_9ROSI